MSSRPKRSVVTKCPHCGATAGHRIILSVRNGLCCLVNLVLIGLDLVILSGIFLGDGNGGLLLPLKRRCTHCRGIFVPPTPPPKTPVCGQCGYDLTGNVSGICPECGWKLTRRVKRRVRWRNRRMLRQGARLRVPSDRE